MNCIFCKIIEGGIPSHIIYEDDYFRVILDRFPSSLGHTLIVSKQHAENIFELDDETAQRLVPLAKKIASALKAAYNFDGLNVLQNNGATAGQTVNHFHLHLIPRYENDNVRIGWSNAKLGDDAFEKALELIKGNIIGGINLD